MNKSSFWAIIMLPVLAISCKKEEGTPAPAVKFMSLTTGSIWNYKQVDNPSTIPVTSIYSITATARDTTINSKIYKVFTNSSGGSEYYNITGSDYYTYRKLPDALGGGYVEVLYLKDNAAAGDTWTQTSPVTISVFTISLTLSNKIEQKGITKIVNGITYTDVVDVKTTLSVSGIPVTYTITSDIDYYYAPKFGQIENKTKIDLTVTGIAPINFDQKTELQSATIL